MTELENYPKVLEAANSVLAKAVHLRDLAIQIQQIPSPTDDESQCAEWVANYFKQLGCDEVFVDESRNAFACIKGKSSGPGVLVSAHTDTVFPADTDLAFRVDEENNLVHGPSIGDNSAGVAALLGLAEILSDLEAPPVDIWLLANSGEEGLGDLRGMKAAMDWLGERVGACIVIEGMGLSRIVHKGLGSRRFRISVQAPGGHSWSDFGNPSAIHVLVQIAAEISKWSLPTEPRATLNIGRITGGRSVNTIAQNASFELDLRCEDGATLIGLVEQVNGLIERYQTPELQRAGVLVAQEIIGDRPTGLIDRAHPLVQAAVDALKSSGLESISLRTSSTDANVPLSRNTPAVCVGVTEGGGAHRMEEWINYALMPHGLHHIILLTWWAADWLSE